MFLQMPYDLLLNFGQIDMIVVVDECCGAGLLILPQLNLLSCCICALQVIGVAQIINKITGEHQFTPKDEEVCLPLFYTFTDVVAACPFLFKLRDISWSVEAWNSTKWNEILYFKKSGAKLG